MNIQPEDGWYYVILPSGAVAWVWLTYQNAAVVLGISRGDTLPEMIDILWPCDVGDKRYVIRLAITTDLTWPTVGLSPDHLPVNAPMMEGLVMCAARRAMEGGGDLERGSVIGPKPSMTLMELMKTPVVVG